MSDLDLIAELRAGAEQVMAASRQRTATKKAQLSTKRPRTQSIALDDQEVAEQPEIVAAPLLVGPAQVQLARGQVYTREYEHHYVWLLDGSMLTLGCAHEGCSARRTVAGESEWDLSRTTPLHRLEEMCWETQSNHKVMCEPSVWQACPHGSGGYRHREEEEWD